MKSEKEIAKWLEEEVDFLTRNDDYCGGWLKLDDTYAAVVLWEEGWGDEKRDDVIQSESDPDYGLCAGVKIFNPADTVDGWLYPSNAETGDLLCESCGIEPSENYEELAKWIMDCYDVVKDFKPAKDGTIVVEVEESLKEDMDDEEIGVKSGTLTPEEPVKPNNKDDAKATNNQRKNIVPNNKEDAKESISESLTEIELKTYDDVKKIKSRCIGCRWEILASPKEHGSDGRYYFDRYKELGTRLFVIEKDGEMFLKKCYKDGDCVIVDWTDKPVDGSMQESLKEDKKEEVEETNISSKEVAFDVLKKILDIHCEKGKCTIALKGTLDDEDEVKLYTELSEEDVESLWPEFHSESSEDEEIKFSDESDEVELISLDSDDEDDDVGEIYDFSDFEDEEPVILD